MKNKLRKITLKTLPNGYSLDVEGLHPGGFLYFNEMELLAGFITHVGLHEENPMESTKMLRIMFQTIIGQEYVEEADNMMRTVAELNKRCQEIEKKLRELQAEANATKKVKKEPKKSKKPADGEMNDEAAAKLAEIEERLKDNPNIKLCLIYDAATNNKSFQYMDMSTGQAVPGLPARDPMFLEDTTIDLRNKIAKNINLNETYPLIVLNNDVVKEY